jgi:hypothetical protein
MSDFFADLETQLRNATVRRAAAERAARVSTWRRTPIAAAVALAMLLALTAGLALAPLGGGGSRPAADAPDATIADRSALHWLRARTSEQTVDRATWQLLGIMRRPQQADDLDRGILRQAEGPLPADVQGLPPQRRSAGFYPNARVLLPSIRTVEHGADTTLTLVPFRPASDDARAAAGDRVIVYLDVRRPGRSQAGVAALGVAPPAARLADDGFTVVAGDQGRSTLALLVPDNVTHVELGFPAAVAMAWYPDLPAVTRDVPVRDNVAVLTVRRLPAQLYPLKETWYDAQGRIIRQVTRRR